LIIGSISLTCWGFIRNRETYTEDVFFSSGTLVNNSSRGVLITKGALIGKRLLNEIWTGLFRRFKIRGRISPSFLTSEELKK